MKNWYQVKNNSGSLSLDIVDEIGLYGYSAKDLINDVKNAGEVSDINISIHSPGGSAFDGIAIYNALKAHPAKVTTTVTGVAASAASIIFMAGDNREMPEDAFLMIHNPWLFVQGDADALIETAEFLQKITDQLINIYSKETDLEHDELAAMLSAETWLNGDEAASKGFATSVKQNLKVAAMSKDFAKKFKNPPKAKATTQDLEKINSLKDFEAFLRDSGGFSKGLAVATVSRAKRLILSESDSEAEEVANLLNSFQIPTLKGK